MAGGEALIEFFDRVLNIASIVLVILPFIFLLFAGSIRFTEYFHKFHKTLWLSIPTFLITAYLGALFVGGMLRRFVLVFGSTQ